MTNPFDIVKRDGLAALAKRIVEEGKSLDLDEHQLTAITIACAKAQHPQLSDAQAFAKVFSDGSADGVALRKAFAIVKQAGFAQGASFPFPE